MRYALNWLVYGFVVIASGCYRYFSRPAGEKGLYFGLVMGTIAITAGVLIGSGRSRAGHAAGFFSLTLVAGWCLFESLIKDGGNHQLRLMLVAAFSVVQAGIAFAHLGGARRSRSRLKAIRRYPELALPTNPPTTRDPRSDAKSLLSWWRWLFQFDSLTPETPRSVSDEEAQQRSPSIRRGYAATRGDTMPDPGQTAPRRVDA